MSSTLFLFSGGKRQARPQVEAHVTGSSPSRLLYVTDKHSKTRFLIDTGAEVSVFPATRQDKLYRREGIVLTAANNSIIHTYGKRDLTLDLGLHRQFRWSFLIADVNQPILGADFLRYFRFLFTSPIPVSLMQRHLSPFQRRSRHSCHCISTTYRLQSLPTSLTPFLLSFHPSVNLASLSHPPSTTYNTTL